MKQSRRRTALLFTALGIVAILLLLVDMATGDTFIPISKIGAVLTGGECDETTRNIILSIRFIRVIVAALIGIALSVSGLQMQTIFQNPLADPYLLGVSSGAGLGVALFILGAPLLGWTDFPFLQSVGIVGSGWIGTSAILLGVAIIVNCPVVMWLSEPKDQSVNIFSCSAELRYCNIWMIAPAT